MRSRATAPPRIALPSPHRADRFARAGQSTLGKSSQKRSALSLSSCTRKSARRNVLSVAEIIALYGQEGFRRMEQARHHVGAKELMVFATAAASSPSLDLRSHPVSFLHDLAQGRAGRAHECAAPARAISRPLPTTASAIADCATFLEPRAALCAGSATSERPAFRSTSPPAAARLIDTVGRCCRTRQVVRAKDGGGCRCPLVSRTRRSTKLCGAEPGPTSTQPLDPWIISASLRLRSSGERATMESKPF